MSKEAWFREFERLEAEHPGLSDETLGDLAHDAMIDRMATRADILRDEAKYTEIDAYSPLDKDSEGVDNG